MQTRAAYFRVHAFTERIAGGNPAGVCPLSDLPPAAMQAVARENGLSETAFTRARADGELDLRWFTPAAEVELCGHATLAAGFVHLEHLPGAGDAVAFHTRSGRLVVRRGAAPGRYELDLPARVPRPAPGLEGVGAALGGRPLELFEAAEYAMAVYASEADVRALTPDLGRLAREEPVGVIATAPGEACDFVSRFFAPRIGVDEDPVTGSAHTSLAPYWAQRLGRLELSARQLSPRGGELVCELVGNRVALRGAAVLYQVGELVVPG